MIRRREFIAGLGSAAAWPVVASAQQAEQMRRLSVLMSFAENDPEGQASLGALSRGLRDLSWTEGRNLRIEPRWVAGGGIDRIRAAVAEVVASNPDVVLGNATPVIQELQRQTRSIPIVFASIIDPVETGVVASLARPGGNATGFMNMEPALSGKWLELLKEVAPGVNRVLVLVNSGSDANLIESRAIEAAAASFGVQVSPTVTYGYTVRTNARFDQHGAGLNCEIDVMGQRNGHQQGPFRCADPVAVGPSAWPGFKSLIACN
jgi:putative ABC transport system substrate-binding protein